MCFNRDANPNDTLKSFKEFCYEAQFTEPPKFAMDAAIKRWVRAHYRHLFCSALQDCIPTGKPHNVMKTSEKEKTGLNLKLPWNSSRVASGIAICVRFEWFSNML